MLYNEYSFPYFIFTDYSSNIIVFPTSSFLDEDFIGIGTLGTPMLEIWFWKLIGGLKAVASFTNPIILFRGYFRCGGRGEMGS